MGKRRKKTRMCEKFFRKFNLLSNVNTEIRSTFDCFSIYCKIYIGRYIKNDSELNLRLSLRSEDSPGFCEM